MPISTLSHTEYMIYQILHYIAINERLYRLVTRSKRAYMSKHQYGDDQF